jgi:hypothetical protein
MKHKLATILVLVVALVVATFSTTVTTGPAKAAPPDDPDTPQTPWQIDDPRYRPSNNDNAILKWDEELLQAIRLHPRETGPTITSRAIGVLHTATYDAWAAYDGVAKSTTYGSQLRRPAGERTLDNKTKAISFAAYRVLTDLFPVSRYPKIGEVNFPAQMAEFGFDPNDTSTDKKTPQGIGNLVAAAVLSARHNDGSNQLNGYADTTGYKPVNNSSLSGAWPAWNQIIDPWRWQPLCVLTPAGVAAGAPHLPLAGQDCVGPNYTVQRPLTPQWKNVTRFAPFTYEVLGPAKLPNGDYDPAEVDQILADTANLTDREKVIAEYWADGPNTEFPPGHAAVFAQVLCRKRGQSIDDDAKLFFMVGNALLDAGVAAWWAKFQPQWDFVRPTTAIRHRYAGKDVTSWLGPYQGYGTVKGEQWRPYQAPTVVTPPFPEYVSGHSTFSAAAYWILTTFTRSDTFGASVTIKAGESLFERGAVPASPVTLSWPTFTEAAMEAGQSRLHGGIHFKSGNEHGRMLGRQVGQFVYSKGQLYIRGLTSG